MSTPRRNATIRARSRRPNRLIWIAALAAVLTIPASADEAPDFSGVWLATSPRSIITADMPELTARARADLEAFDPLDDPVIRCVMPGFPRSGFVIYPFEIVQTEKMLVFLYETFNMVRRIYMDGRQPPEYLPPGRMGFSVGHWDGDELVIETTHVSEGLLSGAGVRQYGDVSVLERYRKLDAGRRLEADITITAPQTFAAPWTRRMTWDLDPDGMIYESVCDPEDSRF
jgi:hypothetical protein